jgi:hypothetical protein
MGGAEAGDGCLTPPTVCQQGWQPVLATTTPPSEAVDRCLRLDRQSDLVAGQQQHRLVTLSHMNVPVSACAGHSHATK